MPLFGPPNVAKLKAKNDIDGLIKALRSENWIVRLQATTALRDLVKDAVGLGVPPDPRAVEALAAALNDSWKGVRTAAADALGCLGDPRALEQLLVDIKDEDPPTRWMAAVPLGLFGARTGDARVVEPLIAALKDERDYVGKDAAKALGWIGRARSVEPLITARVVESLIDALKVGDARVAAAVVALGEIGDARAVEPLIAALTLNVGIKDVPKAAVVALGEIGDARAVKPLIATLQGEDQDIRAAAAEALDRLGWQPDRKTPK